MANLQHLNIKHSYYVAPLIPSVNHPLVKKGKTGRGHIVVKKKKHLLNTPTFGTSVSSSHPT